MCIADANAGSPARLSMDRPLHRLLESLRERERRGLIDDGRVDDDIGRQFQPENDVELDELASLLDFLRKREAPADPFGLRAEFGKAEKRGHR